MPSLLLALLSPVDASELEWEAALGARLGPGAFGVLDARVAQGPWSAELNTDTMTLQWGPESEQGRAWVTLRGQAGTAGFLHLPWLEGEPRPDLAVYAGQAGPEVGALRYLPGGIYAGADVGVRRWFFLLDSEREGRTISSGELLLGIWKPWLQGWARAGVDAWFGGVAPRISGELRVAPEMRLYPLVELRAGIAEEQDELTRTRLGGLSPYFVPLAGSGAAEWWVEDYAAARLGGGLSDQRLRVEFFVDAVAHELSADLGVGAAVGLGLGRVEVDLAGGWSPTVERVEGVPAASGWVLLGFPRE